MWLGRAQASASSPTEYLPCSNIWTIRRRCGWARVLRHSAAFASDSSFVSFTVVFVGMDATFPNACNYIGMCRHDNATNYGGFAIRSEGRVACGLGSREK